MTDETTETETEAQVDDLPGEITIRGKRYVWERHTPGAYFLDLMLQGDKSTALTACGALVLAYPRFAARAGFRRDLVAAAERLYELLVAAGWTASDIMRAGMHAYRWAADEVPLGPSSEEVKDEVDFSEAQQESTSAGS